MIANEMEYLQALLDELDKLRHFELKPITFDITRGRTEDRENGQPQQQDTRSDSTGVDAG